MHQTTQGNTPQLAPRFDNSENVARTISMSSIEISELTGKQHKDVIRDIRVMVSALKNDGADLRHVREEYDGRGYTSVFHLNKELTETLLTGYSIPLRHRVIRRLAELEQAVAIPAFDISSLNDPKVLLALLTDNVRKVVALEADNTELNQENLMLEQKVAADAPKVGFFDAVTVTHETYSVAEAVKLIGTGQNRLMAFLRQRRWVTVRKNEPMQCLIESGHLTAKLGIFEHPENGRTTVSTPRVTGKGLTKLQALWACRDADLLRNQ
ncbi:phage antirepressor KilAC domain-containing protein [Pseudomonas sp. NA-150]|uniref:phage antirepressor KilAC domain-containing protein n=1 Tax=Pseudomonas sp. NA-150 TaxID=3367525 RepID=UPI0037CA101B